MLYDETDWPEWIEELFDNDIEYVKTINFNWQFVEDETSNNYDDIEYA